MVTKITASSHLQKLKSSNRILVIDFYADWCGPCSAISPTYEQLASQYSKPGKMEFVKVDVDAHQDIAKEYRVSAMPTFIILEKGSVTQTLRGANPKALTDAVKAAAERANGQSSGAFQSKGYTLGSATGTTGSRQRLGGTDSTIGGIGGTFLTPNLGGFADTMIRFIALYLTTLFSLDTIAAAEQSPYSIRRG